VDALALDRRFLLVEVVGGLVVADEDAVAPPGGEGLGGALEAALGGAGGELDVGGVRRGAGEEGGLGGLADDVVGRGDDVVGVHARGVVAEASEGANLGHRGHLSGCGHRFDRG
jgi:hypothetical protein